MIPSYQDIHFNFKLEGNTFNRNELKEVAYSYIKEGKEHEQKIGDFLTDWLNDDAFVAVTTSGSTGTPKTIRLSKEAMMQSALATGLFFKLQPENKALLCLPADFIAGKMMLVRAMVLGLHLDIVPSNTTPLLYNDTKYDFSAMVPLQVEKSLHKLHQLKTLIVGGAPVSTRLHQKLQDVSTKIYATYGMTETITHIAAKKLNHTSTKNNYYNTLPNVTIATNTNDCLVIDAPRINANTITTTDVVRLVSETEFEWLGRFDNVINSGGIKLHPEQIEEKLAKCISQRFFVAGIADEVLGQKLILVVEGIAKEIEVALLKEKIKTLKNLSKYEIPKEIYCVPFFKETPTGKVKRNEILKKI